MRHSMAERRYPLIGEALLVEVERASAVLAGSQTALDNVTLVHCLPRVAYLCFAELIEYTLKLNTKTHTVNIRAYVLL